MDREDAAVDAHVPDLCLVRNSADGDNRPVLELERRQLAKLALSPRQVADNKAFSG